MFSAFNKKELEYYDLFHRDKNYEAEAKSLPLTGNRILEIGSGTGLMTRELEKLGYTVFRVEPTDPNAEFDNLLSVLTFEPFDHILALYDVLNYIPPYLLPDLDEKWIVEMWDASKPVKFFTYKQVDNCHRIRLGIRLFGRAHILFIYWGKGLVITKHKLYLHGEIK